ncbi:hypothetical protein E2C01_067231 [Portunus trituberculatus]|uniref:Uncharacterized protein n=1 Tax=Portunus trituberculatus TaxID=210409 RepID=A0A5B7HW43_PORTR|nr:hypothetical protein [Portunus trituberculatus]
MSIFAEATRGSPGRGLEQRRQYAGPTGLGVAPFPPWSGRECPRPGGVGGAAAAGTEVAGGDPP